MCGRTVESFYYVNIYVILLRAYSLSIMWFLRKIIYFFFLFFWFEQFTVIIAISREQHERKEQFIIKIMYSNINCCLANTKCSREVFLLCIYLWPHHISLPGNELNKSLLWASFASLYWFSILVKRSCFASLRTGKWTWHFI